MDTEKLRVVISGAADGLLKAISKASGKIADMAKITGKLSNSSDKGKKSQDGLAKAIETASKVADKASEALDKAKDASMSLADSSKKAEQTVSSLNQSMKELSQSKASGKDYYEAFKKAAEVFKQTYDVIDGAISRVAELGSKARELGTSAEFLQQMQYAAKKTGTDMGAVETSFLNMRKVIDQASLGNEQAAMSLAELGLEYQNLARLSPDDQFREIVDALTDVDDENERARLGTAILGDEYKKISGFVGDFTEKAKDASESIDFIDEKTVSEAQKYKDSFENLGKIFDKIVASNLTEYLASASDCLAELYDFSVKTGQGLWLMVDVLRDAILEVVKLSDKVFDTNFAAQLSEKWSTYLPYSAGPATREEVTDARRRVEAQRKKDEERRRQDEEKREKRRQVSSGAAAIRQEKETAYVRDQAARQAMQAAEERQRQMEEAERRHLDAYKKMLAAEEKLSDLQDRMAEGRTRALAEKNIESLQQELDALSEQESQSRSEYGFDARDAIRLMGESNVDRFRRRRDRRTAESIQDKIARGNAGEKVRFTKREKAMIKEQREIQKAQEEKKRQLQEARDAEARRQQEMAMQAAEKQMSAAEEEAAAARELAESARLLRYDAEQRVMEAEADSASEEDGATNPSAGTASASDAAPVAAFAPSPLAKGVAGTTAAATGPSAIGQQLSAIQAILQQMSTKFYFVQG